MDHRGERDEPSSAKEAVLVPSSRFHEDSQHNTIIRGPDFNVPNMRSTFLSSYTSIGFQATNLGRAIEEINMMIRVKFLGENVEELRKKRHEEAELEFGAPLPYPPGRDYNEEQPPLTLFLGYTSNMASCGIRDVIRFLAQHRLIDCIVTSAGGVEEDIIKCIAPTFLGDFSLRGRDLRQKGLNRIGNMVVPNENYCLFEDWIQPVLDDMYREQVEEGVIWSPSKMIHRFGKVIDNEESIYYWCYRNNIPVFCPAITDGSIGDMIYFDDFTRDCERKFVIDIVQDIRKINDLARSANATGMIILGGGVIKHHICNANLMRNGADFSVFVNTASEFDGSDSGARPDEAISWGKIRIDAMPVKVYSEASIVFPMIVAETFAKYYHDHMHAEEQNK